MFDDITESFADMFDTFIDFIPNLLAALVLLLLGRFISRFVAGLFHRLLKAVNFDHWVDRSGLGAYVERAGYPDSGFLLARIVGWIIMLVFIQVAVTQLGIDSIEDLVESFIAWIPNVIIAIVLIVITGAAANTARDVLAPTLANQSAGGIMMRIITAAIWIFGGMMAIDELGFGQDIIDQLWTAFTSGLAAIFVIKFGVGGIWAARDRFWPRVYDAADNN